MYLMKVHGIDQLRLSEDSHTCLTKLSSLNTIYAFGLSINKVPNYK